MTEAEKAQHYKEVLEDVLPVGLENLGNTCYLNSSLQIMKRIPELRDTVKNYKGSITSPQGKLINELRVLFNNMDTMGTSIQPMMLVQAVFTLFPQFAEKTHDQRSFKQQDADECFQMMLQQMRIGLQAGSNNNNGGPEPIIEEAPVIQTVEEAEAREAQAQAQAQTSSDIIQDLFQLRFDVEFENQELPTEKNSAPQETANKLMCIIAGQEKPVDFINDGIAASLKEQVEKQSPSLQRNCLFLKQMKIANLPKYLIVQKIRFVWKQADVNTNTESRKAKIFRKVTFPLDLDLHEFLNSNLQTQIEANRKIELEREIKSKDIEKEKFAEYKAKHAERDIDSFKLHTLFKKERAIEIQQEYHDQLWQNMDIAKATGKYRLFGVITHKGRSSESGHYIGWTQAKGKNWLKFDDDEVTRQKSEQILDLCGGGDWHTAYYLVYRRLHI